MGGGPAGIDALCEDFDNHLRPRSADWREGVAKKKSKCIDLGNPLPYIVPQFLKFGSLFGRCRPTSPMASHKLNR